MSLAVKDLAFGTFRQPAHDKLNWASESDMRQISALHSLLVLSAMVLAQTAAVPAFAKPQILAITSAASYGFDPLSPGEIVVVWGSGMGPATLAFQEAGADGGYANSLDGVRLFDGAAAPLLYVSATQIAAIVPYTVSGKPATQVQVASACSFRSV